MTRSRRISRTWFVVQRAVGRHKLSAALTGAAICVLGLALASYVTLAGQMRAARTLNADLVAQRPVIATKSPSSFTQGLREFRSSHLVGLLREGESVADVALNEIAFSFEGSPNQPFLRYRAAFEVRASYPAIRKFISHVLGGANGVVLDTVSCSRKDIAAIDVTCDLSFYVAYQRSERG